MKSFQPREAMQVVGRGSTQLLFETSFNVKPAMSTSVGESYEVAINGYTAYNDRVLFTGTLNKTLYYKHPHGKKGNNSNRNEETDKNNDQSESRQDNSSNKSTSSTQALSFLSKIKRTSRKGKTNQQKEASTENAEHTSDNKNQQKKNEKTEQTSSESNELTCLSGSGQIVDSANGIVHFHQQALEFSGTVDIPGVRPGDAIRVEHAGGSTFEPYVAKAAESENNSGTENNTELIEAATHTFAVNVVLVATRPKTETHLTKRKKRISSLPLDNDAPDK